MERALTEFLDAVGKECVQRGGLEYELHDQHDVHLFVKLAPSALGIHTHLFDNPAPPAPGDETQTLHVQGYRAFSTQKYAVLTARVLDTNRMLQQRQANVSVGNEHEAVKFWLSLFTEPTQFPYHPKWFVSSLYTVAAINVEKVR